VPVVPDRDPQLAEGCATWKRLEFPKVLIQYGEAVKFPLLADPTREQQQAVADYILERIRELHTSLSTLGSRGSMRAPEAQNARSLRRRHLRRPVEAPTPGSPTHAS